MPNPYFSRLPLDEAIKTLASNSLRCEICVTYHSDFLVEDPNYDKCDTLRTSTNKSEITRQLKEAYTYTIRYGRERCKNSGVPKFEDLKEELSDTYTIFIRYK